MSNKIAKTIKWGFKDCVEFLKEYGFVNSDVKGSHYQFTGRISGEERIVDVIYNWREKNTQSLLTIKRIIKQSGIPEEYFEEWEKRKWRRRIFHPEIIF